MQKSKISLTRGFGLLENFLARKRADMANKLIHKNHQKNRVLDIGCGTFPYFLASSHAKEKYGMDPSVDLSSFKNNAVNNIFLTKTTVGKQRLPFEDNFFDVITMLAV